MSTTITIHVQGRVADNEAAVRRLVDALKELIARKDIHVEWTGEVGHATLTRRTWQSRTYQRRVHPATFAGPDKRSAWRDGRRSGDLHRERRVPGVSRRSHTRHPMFWLHICTCAGYPLNEDFSYLRSRFCPDCGAERTTFHDRRIGAAERRQS